jgi:prepilin-type N-terminal cleavage/methylation domain-containing protein
MNRSAFTLVELVISLAIATILLAGMTSALFLATRAMPGDARLVDQLAAETVTACDLTSELSYACHIVERGVRGVTFTVPDRNADGSPECIRYRWSGTPGDALMRQYNYGTTVAVLPDVREFALTYDVVEVDEEYTGLPVESAETLLSSRTSATWSQNFAIKDKAWIGQYFCPSFPAAALTWKVTRLQVRARSKGATNGVVAVQLRPALASNLPDTQVLDQALMYENKLISSYRWEEFAFTNASGLTPGAGLCLTLVRQVTDADLAELQYDGLGSGGMLYTADGGATWYYYSDRTLLHSIYGTYTTPGLPQTATRQYVTAVHVKLRAGDRSEDGIDTAVRPVNVPEVLSAIWETEFNTNPTTLDMNGDGSGDWAAESGSFDASRVSGGIWNANSNLVTFPNCDFAQLTTVELRYRCTTVGGAAAIRINADCSGGNYTPLFARLVLATNGTQTLTVYCKPDSGTATNLLTVSGLPGACVTLRLLIDPTLNSVNVRANDVDCGTLKYVLSADSGVARVATLIASGTTAEFDYVHIRVGGN